jgi:hypothetical protein
VAKSLRVEVTKRPFDTSNGHFKKLPFRCEEPQPERDEEAALEWAAKKQMAKG